MKAQSANEKKLLKKLQNDVREKTGKIMELERELRQMTNKMNDLKIQKQRDVLRLVLKLKVICAL